MRVACYVRVSTAEQANEGYSIGEQIERLKNYCLAMDWTDTKIYSDAGFTGSNTDRPALQQMIDDIESGTVNKVVVYKLDRLSRSQLDTLYLIERVFLAHNVDFVSMTENFDTSTPFGRAMIGLLSVFAQLEREQIKERTGMGMFARAKEGKWKGGRTPIGYDYIDDALIVNEFYALQVRELFQLFNDGMPLTRIERLFREKGYHTPHGGFWETKQIRRALGNNIYIGLINYKGDTFKGLHKPVIDTETFEKAQRLLSIRQTNLAPFKEHTTLLGGLLWCAQCGARYGKYTTGNKKSGIYGNYGCYSRNKKNKRLIVNPDCTNKHYRIKDLDDIILGEIKKLALNKDSIHQIREKNHKDDEADKKRDVLQGRINEIESQIMRFLDLYGVSKVSIEQLDAKIISLEEQKKKLIEEMGNLEEIPDHLSEEQAVELVDSLEKALDVGSFEEIRDIITALIKRIEIDGEDITIYWNFA